MNILILISILSAAMLFSGCSSNSTSANTDVGFIGGIVTDQETGDPVANAEVSSGTFMATSSADGSYMLEDIPTGTRTVTITHELYEPDTVQVDVTKNDTLSEDVSLMFGGFGKISGTVVTNGSLPPTTFKLAVVGAADTFDVSENGQFITDYIAAGTLSVDLIPADYYFIQRIDNIEVSRKATTNIGNITLRSLFADHVVYNYGFVNPGSCIGYDPVDYAYSNPTGDSTVIVIDLGANEEAIPAPGPGLEFKIGGAGEVSGDIKVSESDSAGNGDLGSYYDLASFGFSFDTTGGSQVVRYGLEGIGMYKVRYISFTIDGTVPEGRLYYVKVLNQRNDQ